MASSIDKDKNEAWTVFQRQKDMLQALTASSCDDLKAFAIQDHQTGTYRYVLSTYTEIWRRGLGRHFPYGARHLFELIADVSITI